MSSSTSAGSAVKGTKRRAASVQSARKATISKPLFTEDDGPKSAAKTRRSRRASEPELFYSPMSRASEQKPEEDELSEDEMTVAQLQAELRKFNAKVSGKKQELIERLRELKSSSTQAVDIPKTPKYVEVMIPKSTSKKKKPIDFEGEDTEQKEGDEKTTAVPVTKATDNTKPVAPTPSTSTTPAPPKGSGPEKPEEAGSGSSQPSPIPAPIVDALKPPFPQTPAAKPPVGLTVMASPDNQPRMDTRILKVQYPGKPADTIRFDINDRLVVENVAAMLRNLFPDQKVNLDPKLDIEPVYLMDEYGELHVVTLDFLRNCPAESDPPSVVYQARKGTIATTVEDSQLKRYAWNLAIAATVIQGLIATLLFGPRFVFGNLPQFGSVGLLNALHDWLGMGYPASFLLSVAHAATWFLACAYLSPAYRFTIKLWYPRLLALRVDARKGWAMFKFFMQKRQQSFWFRLSGFGRPIPARLGLGVRANWTWLVTKRYLTSNLTSRVRKWLPEALIVTFICFQSELGVGWTNILLVLSFIRPHSRTLILFWQGELNLEVVLWEMFTESLAMPGSQTNLSRVRVLGVPQGIQRQGSNESTIKIRWNPPTDIPRVETSGDKVYGVGVSRYLVRAEPVDGIERAMVFECASPGRDWSRMITPEEIVYLVTIGFQSLSIHPGLATILVMVILYSCFTAPDAPFKGTGMILDGLLPDTEYNFTVRAVDDLNRAGLPSEPLTCRTRPKTLFRRLLLASEEVPRKVPPTAPAPAPVPPATITSTTTTEITRPDGRPLQIVVDAPGGAKVESTADEAVKTSTKTETTVALAPTAPAPSVPVSKTEGHIRYAGVVWNLAMDEKETDLFLRTMRSAILPDPRKEKFEADLIFSTDSKTTHQVISPSYLRTLANTVFKPFETRSGPFKLLVSMKQRSWYTDPLLIAHPAGTRHTFSPETIYSHLTLPKNRVDWGVLFFVGGTVLSYVYLYSQARAMENTEAFWQETYVELFRTVTQMFVLSNLMVMALKRVRTWYNDNASGIHTRAKAVVRSRINTALDVVVPSQNVLVRTAVLGGISLTLCAIALWVNGTASFSGLLTSLLVLSLARTAADDSMLMEVREAIRANPVRREMMSIFSRVPAGTLVQSGIVTAVALASAYIFWILAGGLIGLVGAAVAFTFIRLALLP